VYPDLCLTCHTDLKEKMFQKQAVAPAASDDAPADVSGKSKTPDDAKIYVHAPSDLKDCQICHRPHFSAELALINPPIQVLCGKCHDYKKATFSTAHINIDARVMDCRKCHAPHTSKDPKFFKEAVHKPFTERACKECHIVKKP